MTTTCKECGQVIKETYHYEVSITSNGTINVALGSNLSDAEAHLRSQRFWNTFTTTGYRETQRGGDGE